MRTYEVVCIFRHEEDLFKKGSEFVRAELKNCGGNIVKEDDMGVRTLAYPIKKQEQGHYLLLVTEFPPAQVVEIDKTFKLQTELLKFLFVVQEN